MSTTDDILKEMEQMKKRGYEADGSPKIGRVDHMDPNYRKDWPRNKKPTRFSGSVGEDSRPD